MKLLLSSEKAKMYKHYKNILSIRQCEVSFIVVVDMCSVETVLVSVCCCDEHIPPQTVKLICPSCCSYVVNQLYRFFQIMINKLNVNVEMIFNKCWFKTFPRCCLGETCFSDSGSSPSAPPSPCLMTINSSFLKCCCCCKDLFPCLHRQRGRDDRSGGVRWGWGALKLPSRPAAAVGCWDAGLSCQHHTHRHSDNLWGGKEHQWFWRPAASQDCSAVLLFSILSLSSLLVLQPVTANTLIATR